MFQLRSTLLATLLGLGTPAAAATQALQPLDAFEIEYATDVRISPDGAQVLYVRNGADVMSDERTATVWLLETGSGTGRPLVRDGGQARDARWSPAGDRIAYVTDGEDGSRIRVRWLPTGEDAVVATTSTPPRGLTWSPDGSALAFIMFEPTAGPTLGALPTPPAGAQWKPAPYVTDRSFYRLDGVGPRSRGWSHLYIVPAHGGTPRRITDDGFRYTDPGFVAGGVAWTRDGAEIIVTANMSRDDEPDLLDTELYAFAVRDGGVRRITDRAGPDFEPRVSPDGSLVAYLGFDDRGLGFHTVRAYVVPTGGGRARAVTGHLDRSILDHRWDPTGRALFVSYDEEGVTRLARVGLDGTHEELHTGIGGGFGLLAYGGQLGAGPFSVSDDGRIAAVRSAPDIPGDVGVSERGGGGELRPITNLNADVLGHRTLGRVEALWFPSSLDGKDVQGWIVYPPDFEPSKRYPLILEIHGGPFAAYGPRFDLEKQLMAARGYVVLYLNPRGSTSYGEAFANAIHHDFPGEDHQDLLSGLQAVIDRGFVDPDRLFVTGGSGGGMLAAWIIGRTRRFRAAAVHYPVVDWPSLTLTSDAGPFMLRYWFANEPWEDPEAYRRRSPISLVGAVTTPTLVLSGEQDARTPIGQAEMYYASLKARGVEAVLVRIPDENHGTATHPSHQVARVLATLDWFDRFDREGEP